MTNSPSRTNLDETAGFLGGIYRQARLTWRLLRDARVPGWVKLIPLAGLIYFLSPIDLIPDLMLPGLGEVDDILLILLAVKMFVDLSPSGIVQEHLDALFGNQGQVSDYPAEQPTSDVTIDAAYRVLDQNEE